MHIKVVYWPVPTCFIVVKKTIDNMEVSIIGVSEYLYRKRVPKKVIGIVSNKRIWYRQVNVKSNKI